MHFFFYGTLMASSRNRVAAALHAKLHPVGPATTQGRLFAIPDPLGWYPALLPDESIVTGWLYKAMADFDETDLARMDTYEDFDPADTVASLYLRKAIVATGSTGQSIAAQAYIFNQDLPLSARPIPDGNFTAWLATLGLKSFAEE